MSFLISPSILIKETDKSQYAATTPGSGNVAAMIGYAEKGPFEPTIVKSTQDFVQTFGFTLKDSPYLAQGAYKYFEEGGQLLVVRAGDHRDPDVFPNAAQYASKVLRISPETVSTAGYQTFTSNTDLAAGSFTPSTSYGFRLQADFRGFKKNRTLEEWEGAVIDSGGGVFTTLPVLKLAKDPDDTTKFVANYKSDSNLKVSNETLEFYAANGESSGNDNGDSFSITMYLYRENNSYANSDDFITFNSTYGAAVLGTADMTSGHDWNTTNQDLIITVDGTAYTLTLDADTADADEVKSLIDAKLTAAGISNQFETYVVSPDGAAHYIELKSTDQRPGDSFSLSDAACATLGFEVKTYNDSDSLTGTWYAEVGSPATSYNGTFIFSLKSTKSNVKSFEDFIDVNITSPAVGDWTLSNIVTSIQAVLDSAYSSYDTPNSRATASAPTGGKIKITANGEATSDFNSFVDISAPTSGNSLISLLKGVDPAYLGIPSGGIGEALVTLKAKEKGTYGNNLILRVETQIINYGSTTQNRYNIYVLWNGKQVSSYLKVNWDDPADSNYIITRMANDLYLTIEAEDEDGNSTLAKLPDGDWVLGNDELPNGVTNSEVKVVDYKAGTNGWTEDSSGIITSVSSDYSEALNQISNPEVYDFNLVTAPGAADATVQLAIQSLCDSRRDCFGIVDAAPVGLGLGIKEGTNDITEVNSHCSSINSSYVGAFWPWCQDYDSDNSQYIWLPPSIYALKQIVYTDNIADPWFAPAGTTRGKVSALDVEYSATKLDRDLLYGDTAIVNPIVKFVNEGIVIWGQKTGQRTLTATNRINVRRLLIYAEKLIAKMARGFLFEPNDAANYAAFSRQANAILEPIRQRRGLYKYTVICDETTNPPSLVNQNIMAGEIFLQPEHTIEGITVDFTIDAAGSVSVNENI